MDNDYKPDCEEGHCFEIFEELQEENATLKKRIEELNIEIVSLGEETADKYNRIQDLVSTVNDRTKDILYYANKVKKLEASQIVWHNEKQNILDIINKK